MSETSKGCTHRDFHANVKVIRFEDGPGCMAEVTVKCAECGKPFQFLGLGPGLNMAWAAVSVDGLEARLAICPEGSRPSPLQRMAFGVSRFDS